MDTQHELEEWLRPFLSLLISETRRSTCSHYIASLLDSGGGALSHLAPRQEKYDRLRHFVTSGVWEHQPLCDELARQANLLVGEGRSILVVGDVESSCESAHVVGAFHPRENTSRVTQRFVSLTLVGSKTSLPIASRLMLPGEWLADVSRLDRAEVPDVHRKPLSKAEIALQEIDRLLSLGVKFEAVFLTGQCDHLQTFCQSLTTRELAWVVEVPRAGAVRVLEADGEDRSIAAVGLTAVRAETTLPWARQAGAVGEVLVDGLRRVKILGSPTEPWAASGREVRSDFDALSVRLRDADGKTFDYLLNSVPDCSEALLSVMQNAFTQNRQVQTQLWKEFHLNDFEGRTWQSQHRHMLLTMIAFAYSKY